jgi:NNP family nitrate/nitrite transporter-like MFS transporter
MKTRKASLALVMATLAFTVSFASWSLLSPLAPQLQKQYHINDLNISILIAIPVILGSLARIPMGLLTDRFGGRKVMTALLLFTVIPLLGMMTASSLVAFLFWGFLLGMAGSSFAVGVPFVSRQFNAERQGLIVGIFGMGNIGTALSARFAPQIAQASGWQMVFLLGAALVLVMAVSFYFLAGNGAQVAAPKSFGQQLAILKREKLAWVFSLFYFVTFGGFVSFSLYLPKLLVDQFGLSKLDAGNRVAIFVIVATLARPVGGWLSDRVGAVNVLLGAFIGIPLLALILSFQPDMIVLTGCFLLMAMLFGLGSGAVFKLVPQYFQKEAGTVTGLVGAAGGLGGFFPPIVMGFCKTVVGSYAPGYVLLSVATLCCLLVVWMVLVPHGEALGQENGVRATSK